MLWGIDLGGTKIEGVVLKRDDLSRPIIRRRILTEAQLGYSNIIERISALVSEMTRVLGKSASVIGVATPGMLDPQTNTIKNSNSTCLIGMPLKDDLEAALGLPTIMANDANCFTLAEATLGSARHASHVFGAILGTGVGGGIVINGQVIAGQHGIAGEWGHNVLIADGDQCYCGKRGCVETVLSGPALERFYRHNSGQYAALETIVERAASNNDQHAQATLERLASKFGEALSVVVNILDPEVIVLGGGVSNINVLYEKGLIELRKHIFNNQVACSIVKHSLGDSAGVFGAAMLCL